MYLTKVRPCLLYVVTNEVRSVVKPRKLSLLSVSELSLLSDRSFVTTWLTHSIERAYTWGKLPSPYHLPVWLFAVLYRCIPTNQLKLFDLCFWHFLCHYTRFVKLVIFDKWEALTRTWEDLILLKTPKTPLFAFLQEVAFWAFPVSLYTNCHICDL